MALHNLILFQSKHEIENKLYSLLVGLMNRKKKKKTVILEKGGEKRKRFGRQMEMFFAQSSHLHNLNLIFGELIETKIHIICIYKRLG